MTAFSWKRKAGENVSKDISSKFSADSEIEESTDSNWTESFKRKRKAKEENRKIKSGELKAEGIRLAQLNRFHEAVEEWDKAINLVSQDEEILEMKAQVLLQLNEPFAAVQAAERAVKINPRWWIAYQTLGRSQIGIGDLEMAKRSISKAIHLNPAEKELWEEDLFWTLSLMKEKAKMDSENSSTASVKTANLLV